MSIKIFLAQLNYHIGNFENNTKKIIEAINKAKAQGGDLIVFSELCVCGYPPRDFLYFADFIDKCNDAVNEISLAADGIAVLIGSPHRNNVVEGKDLFNAAFFLADGVIKQVIHKTCLPTYDVFDEDRYFEPAKEWNVVELKGKKIAVTICEDIWNLGNNPLYRYCPMDMLISQHPDLMINLSASPFDYTHELDRKVAVMANVLKYNLPMFYCNCVGSQTELVFDGTSLVFDKESNLVCSMASFEEDFRSFILNDDGSIDGNIAERANLKDNKEFNLQALYPAFNIEHIYLALVLGIRDYFAKMGFKQAIIGSSGGIDSAVTLAIACHALGNENVLAVLMPSQYSTSHSITDAEQLSINLQSRSQIISIEKIYDQFIEHLSPVFLDLPFSVAEENIQSRVRGNILMAIANKFGYILLNTSNKSELSTGYGTLYGDMAGGIGILGDCYKTQVYELAKYINRDKEVIPLNILVKAPSAELRPDQKDADSLPPYDMLDSILYQYIELLKGPDEIKALGFQSQVVDKVLKMVNSNEYKRNQFCPIIRVSPKAFGVGRRMPIVGKYLS